MNKTPRSEREALLKAIVDGSDVSNIQPNSTENYWLKQISNNGISSIKDVTELPNTYGWKGTPVDANTRRIYFNTALSGDEVNKIIDEFIAKIPSEDFIDNKYYFLAEVNDIFCYTISKGIIYDDINGDVFFEDGEWKLTDSNYIDINYNELYERNYNDLLSSLISTTPFEKETFNDKAIYRLEEQDTSKLVEVKGQPIPCDDKTYIDKIYINKNLTVEQVVEILDRLNLNIGDSYIVFADANNILEIIYDESGYAISDNDWSLFDSMDFADDYCTIYSISLSTRDGQPIGLQNDKLKDLFYYTTYGTKTNLYTYDGEWCKLVKERPLKVIDLGTEAVDGKYYLLENGEYILRTDNVEEEIEVIFGMCKDCNYGKFIIFTESFDTVYNQPTMSNGFDDSPTYLYIYPDYGNHIYIKVENNVVSVGFMREN